MKTVFKETFVVDHAGKKRGVIIDMAAYKKLKTILRRIDMDQLWFWTEAWQKKERRAEQAIRKGQVKRFENVEDLLREMKK